MERPVRPVEVDKELRGGPLEAAVGRRVLANALTLGSGEVVARFLSFVATVHLARTLGTAGFGRLELATTVALYASTAATFGLDVTGVLHVVAEPRRLRSLVRAVLGLRLVLAALATLALLLLSFAVGRFTEIRLLLMLTCLNVFTEALSLSWAFRGLEQMKRVAAVGALGQLAYAALVLRFVRSPEDLLLAPALAAAGAGLATLLLGGAALVVLRDLPRVVSPGLARTLLRESAPVALLAAAGLVLYNADVMLLTFLSDDVSVGTYRAAARIAGVFQMLGAAFSAACLPVQARDAPDHVRFRRTLRWMVDVSVVGWVVAAACLVVMGPWILEVTFGPRYRDSLTPLRLLVVACAVVGVRAAYRNALVALRRPERSLGAMIACAGANIGLNLVLIPRMGLEGVALASIAGETLLLVLVRREVLRTLEEREAAAP